MTTTIEVYVLVNDEGGYEVGTEPQEVTERFEENVGACSDYMGTRLVKIMLTVPLPTPIEIEAVVPDSEPEAVVTVK